MSYITISAQDTLEVLATNIVYREQEVHQYQVNIDNYTHLLSVLSQGDWPSELVMYSQTKTEELPYSLPLETVTAISDYQFRDRIRVLIRTETIEQNKAKFSLSALKSQIPASELETLVLAAKQKINS